MKGFSGIFRRIRLPWQSSLSGEPASSLASPAAVVSPSPTVSPPALSDEIRRFKTAVVGDLSEPRFDPGLYAFSGLTTLGLAVVLWASGWPFLGIVAFFLLGFLWGIRRIKTVHGGLFYYLSRRSEIGFFEGYVWVPWFIGGRIKIFNAESFTHSIPRCDSWTGGTMPMHLTFSITFRFSVVPPTKRPFLVNFFWWFHSTMKTETWEAYRAIYGEDFGHGLFLFIRNPDVENAVIMVEALAESITRQKLRDSRFTDLLHLDLSLLLGDAAPPVSPNGQVVELQGLIMTDLNKEIVGIGLYVTELALADLDLDAETTAALQRQTLAPLEARARRLAYGELLVLAEKLKLDPAMSETVLRMEVIRALQSAADKGLLGALVQGTTLEKVDSLSDLAAVLGQSGPPQT